jgi:hypothetical protein
MTNGIPDDNPVFVHVMYECIILLGLLPDWDSHGAPRISTRAIYAALHFCFESIPTDAPLPAVVPTCKGGVQLEWSACDIDIEIEFDPPFIAVMFEDHRTQEVWDEPLTAPTLLMDRLCRAIAALCVRHGEG